MKCFYHNDLDGKCSAFLVYNQFKKFENIDRNDFYEVDYSKNLDKILFDIPQNEIVYFVDYSFKENTKYVLDYLILNKKCQVTWIDHHDSSIRLEEKYGYIKNGLVKGIVSKKYSAAVLTSLFLSGAHTIDEYELIFVPLYVKLVSDYDTWTFKYNKDTIFFKLGMDTLDHNPFSSTWMNLEIYPSSMLDIIERGSYVKSYVDIENTEYRKSYSYESSFNGIKCLVVNKKSNAWIFGDKYNEYPFVVVWVFDGEIYHYSLFSSNLSIDCSKIAEYFGGGGHKGAAGFTSKKLVFKKDMGILVN